MTTSKHLLTKPKLKGQDKANNSHPSFIGNVIATLSGVLLYLDKVFAYFNIEVGMFKQYEYLGYDQETFLWLLTSSVCPILIVVSIWLKAKTEFYVVPLYAYTLQLYFFFFDLNIVDKQYTYWYAGGATILIIVVVRYIKRVAILRMKKRIQKRKAELLNEL